MPKSMVSGFDFPLNQSIENGPKIIKIRIETPGDLEIHTKPP
jgi:hypothetical protein